MKYTPNSSPVTTYYNIHENNGSYIIEKSVKGEQIIFGSFKTLVDAVHERDLLKSVNWDMDLAVEQEYTPPNFDEKDLPLFPKAKIRKCRLKGGKLGFYGAHYVTKQYKPWRRVWQSRIQYNGRTKSLGFFNDPLSAEMVYLTTKQEIAGII